MTGSSLRASSVWYSLRRHSVHRVCSFPKSPMLILILQVLSHPKFFGLRTTDQLGLESLGIFWSLFETGVAVPVACLPTLRPIFHGLSPESVINSIRSMISLSSIHSQQKKKPRGSHDLKSKSGSFEMASEAPFRHKTGFAEPHESQEEGSIAIQVWRLPASVSAERSLFLIVSSAV